MQNLDFLLEFFGKIQDFAKKRILEFLLQFGNQTVHLVATKRRAKQVLVGTGLIVLIISQIKQLLLTLSATNLKGIITSPVLKHFTILTQSHLYLETENQEQDG